MFTAAIFLSQSCLILFGKSLNEYNPPPFSPLHSCNHDYHKAIYSKFWFKEIANLTTESFLESVYCLAEHVMEILS